MELLLGAVSSLCVELFKRISARFGKEITTDIVILSLFIIVMVWTALTQANLISEQTVSFILKVFSASIATYEIIIKRVVMPVIEKINK